MSARSRNHLLLGLLALIVAAVLLLVWIPFDVETGIIEKQRRRLVIGDAFAPTVACVFLLLGALGLLLPERNAQNQPGIGIRNLRFIASALAIIALSLLIMRAFGPLAVTLYNEIAGSDLKYRLLRDTRPWKYLGFIAGGTLLISGLISLVQGRISWKSIAIGLIAIALMIAVYDLPFDDLLLPPNGDV